MGINPVGLQCVASQGSGEGTSQDFPLLPLGSPGERRARASSWLARGSRGARTVSPSAALIRLFFFTGLMLQFLIPSLEQDLWCWACFCLCLFSQAVWVVREDTTCLKYWLKLEVLDGFWSPEGAAADCLG